MREIIYMVIAAIVILIAANLAAWLIVLPRYVSRKISRFQNELVNCHYDEVDIMYRKMRGWRHDYHNHIQTLKAYMELEQYDEVKKYMDMLEEDLSAVDTMLRTGNVMVDAILNSKLTLIRERGITVSATAIVPQDISVSGVDLSVLLGNLLDNAIEACMQVPKEEQRFIRIYIDIVKKQLYICVTNSMVGRAQKTAGIFRTTKESSGSSEKVHGFGLISIDRIVSKYNGYVNRQTENNVFATEVMLPLLPPQTTA